MNKKFFMASEYDGIVTPPPLTLMALTSTNTYFITKSDASFLTTRTGNGSAVSSSPSSALMCFYNSAYRISRIFSLINLSSVPGTIHSAKLVIDITVDVGVVNATIESCPNTGSLTINDYNNKIGLYGIGNDRTTTSKIKIPFNEAGITLLNNKGIQRFVTCEYEHDYLDVAPEPSSYNFGSSAANTTIEIYYY